MTTPPSQPPSVPHQPMKLGVIEEVSIFLRAEHSDPIKKMALHYAAQVTLGMSDWTWSGGPDFGIVTALTPENQRITLVSYDIDYLAMLQSWQEGNSPEEVMEIPADKFAFFMEGWPEDWVDSGLIPEVVPDEEISDLTKFMAWAESKDIYPQKTVYDDQRRLVSEESMTWEEALNMWIVGDPEPGEE